MRGKTMAFAVSLLIAAAPAVAHGGHDPGDPGEDEPYVVQSEWHGMIDCGAGLIIAGTSGACSVLVGQPNNSLHTFDVQRDLKTIVIGLEWESPTPLSQELLLLVENAGCGGFGCSYRYAESTGGSPIIVRIDSPDGEWAFENIEDSRSLQMRVFPSYDLSVHYQQSFQVFYWEFYGQEAPAAFNPFPDA